MCKSPSSSFLPLLMCPQEFRPRFSQGGGEDQRRGEGEVETEPRLRSITRRLSAQTNRRPWKGREILTRLGHRCGGEKGGGGSCCCGGGGGGGGCRGERGEKEAQLPPPPFSRYCANAVEGIIFSDWMEAREREKETASFALRIFFVSSSLSFLSTSLHSQQKEESSCADSPYILFFSISRCVRMIRFPFTFLL